METILEKYGWLVMVVYVIMKDVLPWILNRYFPERMKAEQAKRGAEALMLKSEIEEREHRRRMEERTAQALEGIKEAVVVSNERIQELTNLTRDLSNFTIGAVSDMRETVAKKRGDSQPKIKAVKKAVRT